MWSCLPSMFLYKFCIKNFLDRISDTISNERLLYEFESENSGSFNGYSKAFLRILGKDIS
jgi:hypothetical protein